MAAPIETVDRGIATLRIIVFALAGGVALFTIVGAVVAPIGDAAMQARGPMFVGIAFLLAATHVVGYFVVGRVMASRIAELPRGRDPESLAEWFPVFQARTILGCALAEGAALVAIVFHLLTGAYALLAIPVLAIVAIALQIPSRHRFDAFVASGGRM